MYKKNRCNDYLSISFRPMAFYLPECATFAAMYDKKTFDRQAFYRAVYEIVELVPPGRVTNYGAIARATGYPTLSRMVGAAMGACSHYAENVPAHRVVNANGRLTGKDAFGHPERMQRLLEGEGVIVKNNKVQHFKTLFWDPVNEIVE